MPRQVEQSAQLNTKPHAEAGVCWSEEQKRVIGARNRSLLVSAAAGSGKTAVLVERIVSLITDPDHPIDVDEILVVTFTNAAASEMRERIFAALSAAADAHPDNAHLQRQMSLIHNAQITTIDSFCLQVVTNHFHRIDLEPGFRIADSGELLLLREDVCGAVLEEFYQERDPAFLRFMEGYSDAKNDENIRDMIRRLYDYAQSYPWPAEWLEACARQYDAADEAELEEKAWVQAYLAYLHARTLAMTDQCRSTLSVANGEDGPRSYVPALESDFAQLGALTDCDCLTSFREALEGFRFESLASSRSADVSGEKKEAVKSSREKIKKQIESLKKDFSEDPAGQLILLRKAGAMIRVLVRLTETFSDRFAAEKRKKNILDFSDAEHFALRILVDPDTKEPTDTAREYRGRFREVMIDEYQDSNYLQEAILTAVSGIPEGRQNLFMVGDVKQSIYRFRQANPALFLEKYETFPREENPTQRIDLHKNFRSRPEILRVVNDLFGRIMGRDLGNIEYDADAALYAGRDCEEDASDTFSPECILVKREDGQDKQLAEAGVVARRIRRMIEEQEIPGMQYRDVVVLLRSMTGWPQAFVKAFEQEGVPLLVASQTGYFSAQEVQVVLAMLRVIDNPRQDIPLATLMRSAIGGFTDEELAQIKASDREKPFYACVLRTAEGADREETAADLPAPLAEKTARFWGRIADFRARMPYTPIHLMIQQIYEETGYRDYVTALPAGEQRRANLDMLLEKAVSYENTSYHGLYHFVRYIDRLIRYEMDIGEAETVSEQENAVRLMTIHKSKGLEFPVVFVSGMGRQLNLQDVHADMIFHPSYGAGIKYCDPDLRTKSDTLIRRAFQVETKKESLGEELRVLYVAMTRAREKLILTGMEPEKGIKSVRTAGPYDKLDFMLRMDALTYWDWVLPALSGCGDAYPLQYAGPEEEAREDAEQIVRSAQRRAALLEELQSVDEEILREIDDRFSWTYPAALGGLKQKISVSELKHRAMAEARELLEEEDGQDLFPEEIPVPYIPKFIKEPEENRGALRGTAFHRLMECIDFASRTEPTGPWLESEITRLCREGRLVPEDAERIDRGQAVRFLQTELAGRMAEAARLGTLVREQPFVMSLPADRIEADADPSDSVLIQGIIDAYWEEDDGIVLLDYKTDRILKPEDLILRYRAQLALYAEALGRRFPGKRVRETILYSFCLNEVIPV